MKNIGFSILVAFVITSCGVDGLENVAGLQKFNSGDYPGAIEEFNKAIKREPNKSALFYNRGLAYEKSKDYSKAIADFQQALIINNYKEREKYFWSFYEIGNCYGKLNQEDSCLKYYIKRDELDPGDNLTRLNIAYIYDLRGDTTECCKYLKGINNMDQKFQQTFNNLKAKCKE
jgi:tetratricopeptide (TPR) repeat protein